MHSFIFTGTSGNIAVTSPRLQEIASLTLKETAPSGSTRLIPLTKCTNAFYTNYTFNAGTFHYQLEGVDIVGVHFTPDFNKTVVIPSRYGLRAVDTTVMSMEYNSRFSMDFELFSNESTDTANFAISVEAPGFITSLSPAANVQLQPKQVLAITVGGTVRPNSIIGGTTHTVSVSASNGCARLAASRRITVKPVVSI